MIRRREMVHDRSTIASLRADAVFVEQIDRRVLKFGSHALFLDLAAIFYRDYKQVQSHQDVDIAMGSIEL